MARKGNPISVRLEHHLRSSVSWFSDYYYGKLLYQDVNLRSYFGSIRPSTRLTFGFRLGRSIILNFPKSTFIHFFLPHRERRRKLRAQSRPSFLKGWPTISSKRKVGPISCLHSSSVISEAWLYKKHVNPELSRGAALNNSKDRLEDLKYDSLHNNQKISFNRRVKDIDWMRLRYIKKQNYASLNKGTMKSPLLKCFFSKFSRSLLNIKKEAASSKFSSVTGITKRRSSVPALRPSLNYSVMQYLVNTKNQMHFEPLAVLHHFGRPIGIEPSIALNIQKGRNKMEYPIPFAFFATSENPSIKKCKPLTHFYRKKKKANKRRAHHLPFFYKSHSTFYFLKQLTISLFPFFGATFFFPRSGFGVYKKMNLTTENKRQQVLQRCWENLQIITQDQVKRRLIEKFIDNEKSEELRMSIEMMMEIILRKRRIPYGYNFYLNELEKSLSFLSNRTKTTTNIDSVKINGLSQSASMIAQDISFQLRKKTRSFRLILSQIVKDIPLARKNGVEGIRISCSGRSEGAEIARTECGKYGKTSFNVFHQKIDYAPANVSTRYGISGVKVWISYSQKKKGRAISETY